ncbi:MAG TPA: carboxyl transferase domain-containing protein [Acidimicrobiales bacterium]|nr:carboxyl transferase domain-containing protein [Acidimicrobiales bacterium]
MSRLLAVAACRQGAAEADIREFDGRTVGWFRLDGGAHRGAIGTVEGETIERLVRTAVDVGVPIVGVLATSGADVTEGVASLHAWGRVARALSQASGSVPIVLAVVGPCVSGPALLLGMADIVVMTAEATAYVSGPAVVEQLTGVRVTHSVLGGAAVHAARSGVASLVADDEEAALHAVADVLAYLPSNYMEEPPLHWTDDAADRTSDVAARTVPESATSSYDVRVVVRDVVDEGSVFEVRALHAGNVVTAFATVEGRPVGVIANQPCQLAGTLDIEASKKAARFVQLCDSFNLPLLTFVDTPGFQPGKDIEWRGMIRHGAELVHAYAAATVPRICVVLRKAYGGAFIVMDSKGMGNDACFAWPKAELAVMGAPGAVQILHGKRLTEPAERAKLEADYAARYCSPDMAAKRGYVDEVIPPEETRRAVVGALRALKNKRERLPQRRHSNSPL